MAMGVQTLLTVDAYRQQPLPEALGITTQIAGILITGSATMVSARLDWSESTADWLRDVIPTGIPVLGVCYGHQLLAHALGGKVGPNPRGRQIGTVPAQTLGAAQDDDLLGFLPQDFLAQASHSECVLDLPKDARPLVVSPLDENFAIRFAKNVWGVQFHPEISDQVMDRYIQLRGAALCSEGLQAEKLLERTVATPQARAVLRRFVAITG